MSATPNVTYPHLSLSVSPSLSLVSFPYLLFTLSQSLSYLFLFCLSLSIFLFLFFRTYVSQSHMNYLSAYLQIGADGQRIKETVNLHLEFSPHSWKKVHTTVHSLSFKTYFLFTLFYSRFQVHHIFLIILFRHKFLHFSYSSLNLFETSS